MTKMPRRTTVTNPTSQASARKAQDSIATLNGAAAETFVRSCEACTNGTTTMNAEVMSFINTRLSRDIELSEAAMKCENWAGVVNLTQDWARQAMQDYFAQASHLVQLAAKLTQESWEPVYKQTNQMLTELEKPLS
jgi:hypothetical protein